MPYDIFISYAHQGDNASREAVTALVAKLHAELEADFRRRFNRDLEIFFDKEDIQDFDHWQVRCHRALRDSQFFIACLSRSYLRSDACRWEWEEWCRHELEHGLVGQGAASLWFVRLEDLDAPKDAELLSRWKGDLLQRFHIQCHEWRHDDRGNFLDAAARSELQQLTEHVAQRLRLLTLDRARRGNLPWPNANFVGREPELASLRAALLDAPEQSPAGLHGVGGMGKTALAQAFAYKEADAFPGGCWLLRCEGRDRLLSVFRNLVNDLDFELTDEEKLDDAKAVRRVFGVLRARGPALFLLDSVDRPALLAREQMKLLADQPWARLLYTTRRGPDDFTKAGAMIRPLDLDRLPENQAVDLIRSYQPGQVFASPEYEAAAREIVRELSGLTLAVETAAVYLGQCDPRVAEPQFAVDVRDYLNKLREDLQTGGSEGAMSQLREVTATIRPTLARLDAPALTVLQVASLLSPHGVALPWVRAIAEQSHHELATDADTGESDSWTQLVRGLIGMKLFQPTAEPRVVTIHRILQRVLEFELPENQFGKGKTLERVIVHIEYRCKLVESSWQEHANRWEVEPLVAFAKKELECDGDRGAWLACEMAGTSLLGLGRFQEAESLLTKCLDKTFENDPNLVPRLFNLAQLYRFTDRPKESVAALVRAINLVDQQGGRHHPNAWLVVGEFADVLRLLGRTQESELMFRRAIEAVESSTAGDDPRVASLFSSYAELLRAKSKFEEAETLLRKALGLVERTGQTDKPDYAIMLTSFASLLHEMKQDAEAETIIRRALALDEKRFGPNHFTVANHLINLGEILIDKFELAEAETSLRRAVELYEKCYRKDHITVAHALNSLAGVLFRANRFQEAEPLLRRSLEIFFQSLRDGRSNPLLQVAINNYSALLERMDISSEEALARINKTASRAGITFRSQ